MHRKRRHLAVVCALLGWGGMSLAAGCAASEEDRPALAGAAGTLQGQVAVFIADGIGGRSETRYLLLTPSGREVPLLFDKDLELTPGSSVVVRGAAVAEGFRVSSYRAIAPAAHPPGRVEPEAFGRGAFPLVAGAPYPPRSFAFVMVDLGGGINVTSDGALGSLINDADSLRNYYQAASYGRQDITAQVFGPISYSLPTCTTADTSALARALRPMIDGDFQHYLWYFGSRISACSWVGLASVGTPDAPTRDTWYNASTNCTVLVQEPGHNFGMQHSSSLICPGASFADDPNSCTADEYGDIYDPMGAGCRHMNAWQKSYQGWFGGCNGVAVRASGTFTLLPFERRCEGAQFLKVKAARVRAFDRAAAGGGSASVETMAHYYVELRTPIDFDGTVGNRAGLTPQILIHAGDDLRSRTQRGVHTYLLDMNPQTTGRTGFSDAALRVGATFTDPAGGVSITAVAVGAAQATIAVEVAGGSGDPVCLDGTAFPAPGPGPESCGTGGGAGAGGAGGGGSGGASPDTKPDSGPDGPPEGGGCACALGGPSAPTPPPLVDLALWMGVMLGLARRPGRRRRR